MKDYFLDRELAVRPPVKRAAYSDRTAWILAELSRLVYEPLPPEVSIARLVAEVRRAVRGNEADSHMAALLQRAGRTAESQENVVVETLEAVNFELLESFVKGGTEAFLARLKPGNGHDGLLVLAFRGTQPNLQDIKTDLKANLVSAPSGGRIHRGFQAAFEQVHDAIDAALERHAGLPVYVTGHSLGGALALVATSHLVSDSVGACYTFGAPRVADDEFFKHIKTPVYRVVNAGDGVARLPFGYGMSIFLSLIRLIPVNFTFQVSEWVRRHFCGYTHHGSLVFLSHCANVPDAQGIPFADLKVRMSPNFFWRSGVVVRRLVTTRLKAAATDHSISEYSLKLLAHAKRRNRSVK